MDMLQSQSKLHEPAHDLHMGRHDMPMHVCCVCVCVVCVCVVCVCVSCECVCVCVGGVSAS